MGWDRTDVPAASTMATVGSERDPVFDGMRELPAFRELIEEKQPSK